MVRFCRRGTGFTLVELLVALFVFSLLSAFAYQALNGLLAAEQTTKADTETMTSLQRAVLLWERDMRQAAYQFSAGGVQPSWSVPDDKGILVELLQPLSPASPSSVYTQHIRYSFKENTLYREIVSSSGEADPLLSQPLLSGVSDASVSRLEVLVQPTLKGGEPLVVELMLELEHWGAIRRTLYLGVGMPDLALNTLDVLGLDGGASGGQTTGNQSSGEDISTDPLNGVMN